MHHADQFNIVILDTPPVPSTTPVRSKCLVPGCSCKDARIVSRRRAAFFAAMARGTGQTADRIVPVDPTWAFTWVATGSRDAEGPDVDDVEEVAA